MAAEKAWEEQGAAMAGRAPAPAAGRDKSSFAATCSLLSRYLKENKGGLHGVTGLGIAPPPAPAAAGASRPTTTMNLLSALGAPADEPSDAAKATTEPRASESLEKACTEPPPVLVAPTCQQNGKNPREAAGEELQQLTIFYGGKVVVFDNFPSTKVKDLLQIVKNPGDGADRAIGSAAPQDLPRPSHNNLSDLPIARRNSLHRFLEKRKDRIISKAPYQANSSVEATAGGKSWLGLGQEVTVKEEI